MRTKRWIEYIKYGTGFVGMLLLASCTESVPKEIEIAYNALPDKVDYNLHVKPLLSDRCFACHGPDKNKQKAGLRLDTPDGAFSELPENKGKHAIVPGNLSESEVVNRILSNDPKFMMPTPESHLSLNEEEKALIVKWIKQGAEYKTHWSLIPPAKTDLPDIKLKNWPVNEIDFFVARKLEEKKLIPAPEADKETLLRRVSLDLTGLPPTPSEIDAFLADTSIHAYEKVVNRLLASPHYGERMASDWLDLARYADTHGYQDDGMRNSFPYRDWVIRAFNRNLSFDRFVTWQLAGDLLPNPDQDKLIATSFNRNHPQSQEGGIIDEEYRTEYVADRANTFGKAFLGLTIECARCHDHKYDPISQKDYYSLFAFFNQNKESGIIPYNGEASPSILLPDKEVSAKLEAIRKQMVPLLEKANPNQPTYKTAFQAWQSQLPTISKLPDIHTKDLLVHVSFDTGTDSTYTNEVKTDLKAYSSGDKDKRPRQVNGKFGTARQLIGDCGIDLAGKIDLQPDPKKRYYTGLNFERNQPFSVSLWVNVLKKGIKGPIFNRNNGEFEGFRGYDVSLNADGTLTTIFSYVWPANCIEIRTQERVGVNQWTNILLTYDGSAKAEGISLYINGKQATTQVITDHLTKSILHGPHNSNWSYMPFEIGKNMRGTIADIQVDELLIYKRKLTQPEITKQATGTNALYQIFTTPIEKRTPKQQEALFDYYLWNIDESFASYQQKLSELRLQETVLLTDIPEVMTMSELPTNQKRKTFILARGAYDAPMKEPLSPHTPATVLAFDSTQYPANRLGLARWLLDKKNPLFSRVMVNRFWAMYFGKGLVSTIEDFGNQGALPTHPELLDWLAVYFRESGWNAKALHKKMVMSATYRQSSLTSKISQEIDPDNTLLSRAPSYRLSAEVIRDKILAASGLLTRKIGGPSVYPYQPAGIWEALATRNATSYTQSHGEDLYRRSLYTVWKRSSPPPSMLTFDVPDRYFCVVRRQKTSTPLQALILMNDPQYMEASRLLGERMMKEGGNTPEQRISFAFKALVGRHPRDKELNLLNKLYAEELADFQKQPQCALSLLSTGEYPVNKALNVPELAACSMVATTLINFEETVMKR
ncbi:DUF1553 domain-containing protein [Xanthocytophaga agilis]|uniref:DUF1553 domain-containing protein n=1 Tax=Xanthocytophaga agilis TaxID=3048010 RepID=A0AAE3R903_9BACT|nr:DUF1553 domain-containing protein [Xanthocytophaga agilis]MDJ1505460.1 DUF1553 domain-containing protein [Xanthocytophaga agilis]